MPDLNSTIHRGTGLLVIEVAGSNPNGDPDRESDPRIRPDERGEISPVSLKRKLRDLIDDKAGVVWQKIQQAFNPELDPSSFGILESRGRNRETIKNEIADGSFTGKYWDGRVFGNTFLEDKLSDHIRCGVVQFGLGVSIAPIRVERLTTTNKSGVQEGKDRGMAPLGFRVVEHAVYAMPFYVNASAARKTGCTSRDIEVLQEVLPYAYSQTASYVRNTVEIRHAWYVEHKSPLGSVGDFAIVDSLRPVKNAEPDRPSSSWSDYSVPISLPPEISDRVSGIRDLMAEVYAVARA
jgi:Cas7 group CRISPR-associated protein Csh2